MEVSLPQRPTRLLPHTEPDSMSPSGITPLMLPLACLWLELEVARSPTT